MATALSNSHSNTATSALTPGDWHEPLQPVANTAISVDTEMTHLSRPADHTVIVSDHEIEHVDNKAAVQHHESSGERDAALERSVTNATAATSEAITDPTTATSTDPAAPPLVESYSTIDVQAINNELDAEEQLTGTRQNMQAEGITSASLQAFARRATFYLAVAMLLAQLIATVVILATTWSRPCDENILIFNVGYAVRVVIYMPVLVFKYRHPEVRHRSDVNFLPGLQYRFVKTLIDLLMFSWFLVGCWAFFTQSTCKAGNPAMYDMTLAWVILGFVSFGLPALALLTVAACFPVLYLIARIAIRLAPERFSTALGGMSQAQINKIPTRKYSAGMLDESHNTCAICLVDFAPGEELRVLPCKTTHLFHTTCVDDWLRLHRSCPTCRYDVVENKPQSEATPRQTQQHQAVPQQQSLMMNLAGSAISLTRPASRHSPSRRRSNSSRAREPTTTAPTTPPTATPPTDTTDAIGHPHGTFATHRYAASGSSDYMGSGLQTAWRLSALRPGGRPPDAALDAQLNAEAFNAARQQSSTDRMTPLQRQRSHSSQRQNFAPMSRAMNQ